jgi:hypothetical protein
LDVEVNDDAHHLWEQSRGLAPETVSTAAVTDTARSGVVSLVRYISAALPPIDLSAAQHCATARPARSPALCEDGWTNDR